MRPNKLISFSSFQSPGPQVYSESTASKVEVRTWAEWRTGYCNLKSKHKMAICSKKSGALWNRSITKICWLTKVLNNFPNLRTAYIGKTLTKTPYLCWIAFLSQSWYRVELKCDAQHGTLDELLRGKLSDVPKLDVLEILWQLFNGLEHLHLHNIVHGCLTLDNVLVSKKDKSLLLTNYGFAKWRSPQPVLNLN